MPAFLFATCGIGLERGVRSELARTRPDLHLSFSRPGLLTFKAAEEVAPTIGRPSVFARVWGRSLGLAVDADAIAGRIEALPPMPTRLHVAPRDPATEGAVAWAREIEAQVRARLGASVAEGVVANAGERVIDVIVSPGEASLVGVHVHAAGRSPLPGGELGVVVPDEAPSRAFTKMEEAIRWADLDVRPGDVALEIGSAPGGSAYALVRRGVDVWAVDPAALDERVLAYRHHTGARVHHLRVKVGGLRPEDLPPHVDWLSCDIHLAPNVAIHALGRLLSRLRPRPRGAVITLKLNEWRFVDELPTFLERIRLLGYPSVTATHLPSNRREVCVVARLEGEPLHATPRREVPERRERPQPPRSGHVHAGRNRRRRRPHGPPT